MTRSPLLPIFLIVAIDVLGMTIILPLLPFYSESLGASPFIIGTLISSYGLCQFLSGPVLGQLSDRVGRRPVLLISQLGTLAGFILLALSRSLLLVFLARIVDGLTAGNISVAQAYISDNSAPKDRTRAFGIVGAAFGLGFLIGPAISGVLAKFGNAIPIWAAACLSALSIVCTYTLLPKGAKPPREKEAAPARPRDIFGTKQILRFFAMPEVAPLLLQFFTFAFAFTMFVSGLALFLAARFTWDGHPFNAQQVGYIFAYSGAINLCVQMFLMKWMSKYLGDRRIIIMGFLLMSIGYATLGSIYAVPVLIFCLTFNNFGGAALRPAIQSSISQSVSPAHQGAVMGVVQALQSISQIIAPLISGYLIGRGWLEGWSAACAGVAALGFLGLIHKARRERTRATAA